MSGQDTAVIPLLKPLILGQPCVLTPNEQRIIWIWVPMKAIVGEMDDPVRRAIPPDSAHQFYHTRNLRMLSKTWLGKYTDSTWSLNVRYHHSAGASSTTLTPPPPVALLPENVIIGPHLSYFQTTTLCIGQLFIHFATATNPYVGYRLYEPARLRLIEIPMNTDLTWPPPLTIDDIDAQKIASWLYDPACVASWI